MTPSASSPSCSYLADVGPARHSRSPRPGAADPSVEPRRRCSTGSRSDGLVVRGRDPSDRRRHRRRAHRRGAPPEAERACEADAGRLDACELLDPAQLIASATGSPALVCSRMAAGRHRARTAGAAPDRRRAPRTRPRACSLCSGPTGAAGLRPRPDRHLRRARDGLAVPARARARRRDPAGRHDAARRAGRRDDRDRDRDRARSASRRRCSPTRVGQRVMHDLRAAVYRHLQRLSLAFFTRTRTGEIQSRIANDIGGVQNVVTSTATSIVSNVTTVLARDGRDVPARLAPRALRARRCCRSSSG